MDIENLRRVTLNPDDVIVYRTPAKLCSQQYDVIAAYLRKAFGADRKIIIIDNGSTIEIVTKE